MSSRPFFFNFRFRLYTVNRRMTDRTYFIQVVKRIDVYYQLAIKSVQASLLNRGHDLACIFDDAFFDQGDIPGTVLS